MLARGEGALAEARPLCDSQMDDAHAMLASDPAFRAEWATFCRATFLLTWAGEQALDQTTRTPPLPVLLTTQRVSSSMLPLLGSCSQVA